LPGWLKPAAAAAAPGPAASDGQGPRPAAPRSGCAAVRRRVAARV